MSQIYGRGDTRICIMEENLVDFDSDQGNHVHAF